MPYPRKKTPPAPSERPRLGLPHPLEASQEEARCAKEGNRKLALAVETLRAGLETITIAEIDRATGFSVTAETLRRLAGEALDAYGAQTGQNWRSPRNKISGPTRAAGTGNPPQHEARMGNGVTE